MKIHSKMPITNAMPSVRPAAPPISDKSCGFEYSGYSRLTLVVRSMYNIIDVITIGLLSFSDPRCA